MRFTYFLICFMLLILGLPALALDADDALPENGIWTGVIGDSKVMACFQRDDDPAHTNRSGYFYLRYSKLIPLASDHGTKNTWLEGDIKMPTGIWTIHAQHDKITGNWSNLAKTKKSPILLNRFKSISSNYSSGACSPEDMFDPVVYSQVLSEKITFGEETLNGRRYRVLSALNGAVGSIELFGDSKAIHELNALLTNELRASVSAYYGCPTNGERHTGKNEKNEKPDYSASVKPLFLNEQWISLVAESSGNCGGAYPFSNYTYSTWSVDTAKELNLWEWLKNSHTPVKLNKIIIKKAIKQRLAFNPKEASEENNCLDVIERNSGYQIRLGKAGFIFSQAFPHVTQACNDDVEIAYGELMPFLTKKGRKAVTAILSNGS